MKGAPVGRRALLAVALIAWEAVFARAYILRGTSWHLLLHTLIGVGLGLAAAAWWSSVRRRPTSALQWALGGQLLSSFPDLLFVFGRVPHQLWMDAFVGHVSVHTAPQPLLVALGIFLLGGWAWERATAGARRAGSLLGAAAAGLLVLALATHAPLPTTLGDYSSVPTSAAFWCR